jgi:amino acid transporter
VALILVLCVAIWVHRGGLLDMNQLSLSGVGTGGVFVGVVLAIFAFVGFESAGSLGMEARNPHRAIGRAILLSCVMVGLFYVVVSYSQVYGFQGTHPGFAKSLAPMPDLAGIVGLGWLAPIIDLGIVASMFACTLACTNAAARIAFAMAHDGMGTNHLTRTHSDHHTPHIAIWVVAVPMLLVPLVLVLAGQDPVATTGWAGTIATFGFMLAYALVAVAAPAFLRREGTANRTAWITGGAAAASMAFVFWVNWLPQVPHNTLFSPLAFPYTILPYVFFGWTAVGLGSYLLLGRQAAVGRGEQFTVRAVPAAQAVPAGQAVPD